LGNSVAQRFLLQLAADPGALGTVEEGRDRGLVRLERPVVEVGGVPEVRKEKRETRN
jgi:hypothetical protein